MGGNAIALTLVLSILSNAMVNAMAAWTSVGTSVLFLWIRQPRLTNMSARTSASATPWPARAAVQHQTQSSAGTDVWQTRPLCTTLSVKGSASPVGIHVMESASRDMLNVREIATLHLMWTSTSMIVMEHALQSHGLVMGSVLRDMLIAMDIATVKLM